MKVYHYSACFSEVKKLFEVPTRKEGNLITLSELYYGDGPNNPVFDIRIYHEGIATNIGLIVNGYVLRKVSEFLSAYFEEKDNENIERDNEFLNEQLGHDFEKECKRE